jgi:hypothetical protein
MDRPNAAGITRGVEIDGDVCDLHVRMNGEEIIWCGVYVRPAETLVPGYWFEPTAKQARELVGRFMS